MKASFPASTCKGGCKYVWGRMQVRARADARTCGDGCKYLRGRLQVLASEMSNLKSSVLFWIRERGGKTHSIRVTIAPRKFLPNRFMTKMRERVRVIEREKKQGIEPTETQSPLYNVKSLFKNYTVVTFTLTRFSPARHTPHVFLVSDSELPAGPSPHRV